jgi:adenosylmethionine-8-amino-7-oxononanoate aminotransferase
MVAPPFVIKTKEISLISEKIGSALAEMERMSR